MFDHKRLARLWTNDHDQQHHDHRQHEPNVVFSMTYRHAASTPHAGELGDGGSVDVKKKGTVFNVTRTVQS